MSISANHRAALLISLGMCAFSINDVISKAIIGTMNVGQLMFVRGIFITVIVLVLAWRNHVVPHWRILLDKTLALRMICEVSAVICYITALGMMPIANASAILQAVPLCVTLGAVLLFKEKVEWRRWCAIFVGLAGVLVIVRPGPDGFAAPAVLCLANVFFTAGRDLSTRVISKDISSLMISCVTAISVTIVGALITPVLGGWQPMTLRHVGLLILASILVLIGYQTIVAAMRTGEISFAAPFRYTGLLFSTLLGMLVFGEFPDKVTVIGGCVVIGAGIYGFYCETFRKRPGK